MRLIAHDNHLQEFLHPDIVMAMHLDKPWGRFPIEDSSPCHSAIKDARSFIKGLQRLRANIADTWPHLEPVLGEHVPSKPADVDVDDETWVNQNKEVALYRSVWKPS